MRWQHCLIRSAEIACGRKAANLIKAKTNGARSTNSGKLNRSAEGGKGNEELRKPPSGDHAVKW
jgi:hypothetical protein